VAVFPYGIRKTEQKATFRNIFNEWDEVKKLLMDGLGNGKTITAYKPTSTPHQLLQNTASGIHPNYRKIMIPMIRKILPGTIAQSITGVQPMSGPMAQIFSINPGFDTKTIRLKIEKVDMHWHIEFNMSAEKLYLVEEWLKNIPKEEYWIYHANPWAPFCINLYSEDTVTAFKLTWDNYVWN
jgi:hypothetical protein